MSTTSVNTDDVVDRRDFWLRINARNVRTLSQSCPSWPYGVHYIIVDVSLTRALLSYTTVHAFE